MRRLRAGLISGVLATVQLALSALLPSTCASATAADQPYDVYTRSRIDDGLEAIHARAIGERVEGAYQAALYIPFPDDAEKAKLGSPEYWSSVSRRMRALISENDDPWVRYHLLAGLVRLDEESDVPFILAFLAGDDPTLRKIAVETSARHPSTDAEQQLVSLYPNQSLWWVKAAFLEAMGSQKGDQSLAILQKALSDPSRDVRAAASGALANRPDPRSIEPLVEAMRSAELTGADSPVAALAEIKSVEAYPALTLAARSPYPFDREYAAGGLKNFPSPESYELLKTMLRDKFDGVNHAAAGTLIAYRTKEAAESVLLYLADYSQEKLSKLQQGWDSVFEDFRGMRDSGIDLAELCDGLVVAPDQTASRISTLQTLAVELRRRGADDIHMIISSADTHSVVYSRYNADAREVAPSNGRSRVVGWQDAPLKQNGGTKEYIPRGTQVTVRAAAFYAGETWLQVCAGPYGDDLWVREADLRPVVSEQVLAESERRILARQP